MNLKGKKVIISGSTKGIGKDIALSYIKSGALVLFNGRSEDDVTALVNQYPGCIGYTGDLTEPDVAKSIVSKALKEWGQIDIVVCNIGSGKSVPPGEESLPEWKRIFDLNLFSTTNLAEASLDALEKSKGNIVCISSICGHEALCATLTYSAAKAALNAYVKGLSKFCGKKSIRVNAVSPGNIMFEGSTWENKIAEDPERVKTMLTNDVALGRLGTTDEIAQVVMFLSSDLASFCTGSIFVADGGQLRS